MLDVGSSVGGWQNGCKLLVVMVAASWLSLPVVVGIGTVLLKEVWLAGSAVLTGMPSGAGVVIVSSLGGVSTLRHGTGVGLANGGLALVMVGRAPCRMVMSKVSVADWQSVSSTSGELGAGFLVHAQCQQCPPVCGQWKMWWALVMWLGARLVCHRFVGHRWHWPTWCSIDRIVMLVLGTIR